MSNRAVQTFAESSEDYLRFRPNYPVALIDWVASLCDLREAAWDCATGNGQAACALAPHFKTVFATDVSQEQLAQAPKVPNVSYSIAPAEACGLKAASVDLITVAQALHWFDFAKFWPEVRRVGRRRGIFAAWGYSAFQPPSEIQSVVMEPLNALLAPHWSPRNRILWDGYKSEDILFPFQTLPSPTFNFETHWSIEQMIGHIKTWSAYRLAARDPDVLAQLVGYENKTRRSYKPSETFKITIPLLTKAARLP